MKKGRVQIPPHVKSRLSEAKKWPIHEGAFVVKVSAAHSDVVAWLRGLTPEYATYFSRDGVAVARQFALPMGAASAVWRAVPNVD